MITGVETAGLVLAIFPIVVEGLKAYVEGVETIKRYWKYAAQLKHLIRILRMEEAKFSNTCTELLHDLVAAPELALLLEDPGGWRWRDAELQIKLKARLGRGFHAYLEAVTDMTDILDEFRRKLELDSNDKAQWVDYKLRKREWKRVKLSLSEESNEKLLKRMEKNNGDLEMLLGQSLRLETAKPPPKSTNNAKRYERVRTHAKNIYNMLRHGFTQPCGCPIPHYANLQLEARTSGLTPSGRNALGNGENLRFNVLCHFETTSVPHTAKLPWNWRETIIEPLEDDGGDESVILTHSRASSRDEKVTAMATTATVTNDATGGLIATARFLTVIGGGGMNTLNPTHKLPRKKSKVSFSMPDSPDRSGSASPIPSSSPSSPTPPQLPPLNLEILSDLCKAIHQRQKELSCLGLLVDTDNRKHRISLAKNTFPHISNPSQPHPQLKTISLKQLLLQARKLEKRDRLILGVKLASSVLQLYHTPWLRDIWGKSDIFFVKYEDPEGGILISRPFLSKAFQSPVCSITPRVLTEPYAHPSPDVRNQTIFALGVILIELWFGRPLETLRLPSDLGDHNEANQITDFATARRLSEEIYSEAGDWYGDAVRRCIYCEFDQRNTSLEAEALKEAVYRGVVSPLQDNLTSFCGGKLDDILS